MPRLAVVTWMRIYKFPDYCFGLPLMRLKRRRKWSLRGVFGWFSF